MKRLEYTEPVTEIDSGTLYKIIQNEYPLLYQGMKTNGFGVMENYIKIKGLYFPQNLPKLSEKLRYIWEELVFICLPLNITDTKIWGWMYDLLHTILYVEKDSPTEKLLKSRNYPYTIKHGLPEIDGKQIEHSQNFAIWIKETDDEEKRKFLEKTEVPATKTPYEPCPVPEQTEKIITPAETKKLKIKQEFLTIYEMIPQKRKKETLYGILISAFIVLLFAILL